MSRGRIIEEEPGLQYPADLEGNTSPQSIEAFRIAYQNLFYLRAIVRTVATSKGLTADEIRALVLALIKKSSGGNISVIVDTHAIRLTAYPTPSTVGSIYFEYDRTAMYIGTHGTDGSGVLQWQLAGAAMVGLLSSRPSDLSTADAGFEFTDSTSLNETQYVWLGTKWITGGGYLQEISDAVTNAVTTILMLRHLTSGTAASGYGAGLDVELEDSGGTSRLASQDQVSWRNAGTTTAGRALWLRVAGVLTQCLDLTSTALTALGNLVFNAGTAFTCTLTHANTGNRVLTTPDATGNLTYETAVLTNNNFLFGGGGALVKDAGFAVVPVANGGSGVAYDRVFAVIDLTAQTATAGPTTIASAGAHFLFSYYLIVTTADALSVATLQLTVSYTDDDGGATQSSASIAVSATNRDSGVFVIQRASGNVTYTVTLTGAIGSAQYALHATLQRFS